MRTAVIVFVLLSLSCLPAYSGGYLWISSEFVSDPAPISRYNIQTGVIDMSPIPGMAGDVCNNLATDGTTLYLGTDDANDFWKADPYTGVPYFMGAYNPPTNPSSMEDGAYRASNGHLYRANMGNSAERMYETDTNGNVLAFYAVANVDFFCGLEFVGDQLYGTSLDDGKFGTIDNEPAWQLNEIVLSGIPAGHAYGGLAYDQQSQVLYMATTDFTDCFLWTVDPGTATATLVVNLTQNAGFPTGAGYVLPDAMGWVPREASPVESTSWGQIKSLFR